MAAGGDPAAGAASAARPWRAALPRRRTRGRGGRGRKRSPGCAWAPPSGRSSSDYRIHLRFDEPVRIDEARHLDDRVDRTHVSEELAVNLRDRPPVVDASEHDAGANDVAEARPQLLERDVRDLEAPARLGRRIADAHGLAVGADRRGPR